LSIEELRLVILIRRLFFFFYQIQIYYFHFSFVPCNITKNAIPLTIIGVAVFHYYFAFFTHNSYYIYNISLSKTYFYIFFPFVFSYLPSYLCRHNTIFSILLGKSKHKKKKCNDVDSKLSFFFSPCFLIEKNIYIHILSFLE
jgi:hypothetical protein